MLRTDVSHTVNTSPVAAYLLNRKRLIALFFVNFLIIGLAYSVFIDSPHYSCDTYAALAPHELANVNIKNGRFIHYLLYSFLDLINCDLPQHMRLTQLLLTAVCAFGTSMIANRFIGLIKTKRMSTLIILDSTSLLIVINPYFLTGWYYWPETCVGASVGTLIAFLSIITWCSPQKKMPRRIACLALVTISVCMYQVYFEFFIGGAIAYTLLEHTYKAGRDSILEVICAVTWCALAGIINLVAIFLLSAVGGIEMARTPFGNISVFDRLWNTWASQYDATLTMYGMLPPGFLVCAISFLAIGAIIIGNRRGAKPAPLDVLFTIASFCAAYAVVFVPELVSHNAPVPRLFAGIFTLVLPSASGFALVSRDSKLASTIGALFAIALICISSFALLKFQADTIRCNAFDDAQLNAICKSIDKYETDSGQTISEIRYCYDATPNDIVPGVANVIDVNKSGMRAPWFFNWAIKNRLGDRGSAIQTTEMSPEEQGETFGNTDWDYFDPSQQIIFDGPVAYIAIY